jgi:hypothetical protein
MPPARNIQACDLGTGFKDMTPSNPAGYSASESSAAKKEVNQHTSRTGFCDFSHTRCSTSKKKKQKLNISTYNPWMDHAICSTLLRSEPSFSAASHGLPFASCACAHSAEPEQAGGELLHQHLGPLPHTLALRQSLKDRDSVISEMVCFKSFKPQ